jgi:F0F1-type ATP synthase assembly protein I
MNSFQKILKKAVPVMAAVQSLFFYVIILSSLGYFIDHKLKTFPLLFIIFLIIGMFIGFYQLGQLSNVSSED